MKAGEVLFNINFSLLVAIFLLIFRGQNAVRPMLIYVNISIFIVNI